MLLSCRRTVSLLWLLHAVQASPVALGDEDQVSFQSSGQPKAIAIVGAGSAGLAILKTLLDLPHNIRRGWEITLYEQRRDVGGVWLPDPNEPHPPVLPETPLYPDLRTNTPVPTMTYPGSPFKPFTPLYPNHKYIWQYHADYAKHFNLTPHIILNATVIKTSWIGNSENGKWNVTVQSGDGILRGGLLYDHLIVASGHNHYPYIPKWPGHTEWLEPKAGREILHSIFWRDGKGYTNKTVVVVGGNASGRDIVLHTYPYARKTYLSLKGGKEPTILPMPNVTIKHAISRFNATSVIFEDGTSLEDVDSVLLGTGYELRIPFLTEGGELDVDRTAHSSRENPNTLTTNLRYLFPLHEHILSLASAYPPTALSFIGLPILVANCPSDIAQALFVAHAIARPDILPSRSEMLAQLHEREAKLREAGLDPYYVGHRLVDYNAPTDGRVPDMAHDYQDALVDYLKQKGALPEDGKKFVEPWRRIARKNFITLWKAWARVEELGDAEVKKWLTGVETEEEWASLMGRLIQWWENEQHSENRNNNLMI